MTATSLSVSYDAARGLRVCWGSFVDVPVRVHLCGQHLFSVWGVVDSGEGVPVWAEPNLDLLLFSGISATQETCHITNADDGVTVTATHARVEAVLTLRSVGETLEASLAVRNPQGVGGVSFPLCLTELIFEELDLGPGARYYSAHPYGGRTHGVGAVAELAGPGVSFVHGCIGQALPLTYLHQPSAACGLEFEFMLDERPVCWLRPGSNPTSAGWCVSWTTDRLLAPGQVQAYGGALRLTEYQGHPISRMRHWRDTAEARYGLLSPPTPAWARRANIIEFNMNPDNEEHDFTRLDDPRCLETLVRWKDMGFTAMYAVSPNNVGQHWLSPFDYDPCARVGGTDGEGQVLRWARELGFHTTLWVTTVGIDRDAVEVTAHPDWFTRRTNGALFYAWDSHPPDYLGYAPDGDPLSTGWRAWLKDQVRQVIARGYDGIFIDGCIPRASNHARWAWPGEGRNGVEDQVRELAAYVRTLGTELVTFVEDESLTTQACCEITVGRYHAAPPFFKKAYWDHGMGGGPEAGIAPPSRIPPECAREYLLIRYASLLPGTVSNDILEGYISEETRPWVVQSLLAGMVPKTHSNYLQTPERYIPIDADDPPAAEQAPAHRRRGYEEFISLIQFCRDEPLIRDTPLSIEGVVITGDDAVVGLLRPTSDRCLLTLIQFAGHSADVSVQLADPCDVPACAYAQAGQPASGLWEAHELLASMVETMSQPMTTVSGDQVMTVHLGAYSFRIFELVPAARS